MIKEQKYSNFPKRPKQHVQEANSIDIFKQKIPKHWVIRGVTERDYGIDLFVEIVQDDHITGKLFTCQLKSIEKIKNNLTCNNIKPSTFNYWYALPTTTFVFFIDIQNKEAYYCNVKKYIRQNYEKFKKGTLKNIKFDKDFSLSKLNEDDIEKFLIQEYNKENSLIHIENQMISFILNLEKNLATLDEHLYRDSFLSLSDENFDDFEYILMYEQFKELYEYFGHIWDIKDLDEFYKDGLKMFPDYNAEIFYEAQASQLSKCLIPKLIELFIIISENIKKNYLYWSSEHLYTTIIFNKKYKQLWKLIIEKMKYYEFLFDKK